MPSAVGVLEKRIHEGCERSLADDYQNDEKEKDDQDRGEPPFLVLAKESPEFAQESRLAVLRHL